MSQIQKTAQRSLGILFLVVGSFAIISSARADTSVATGLGGTGLENSWDGGGWYCDDAGFCNHTEGGVYGVWSYPPETFQLWHNDACASGFSLGTNWCFYQWNGTGDPSLNFSNTPTSPPNSAFSLTAAMFAGFIAMVMATAPVIIGLLIGIASVTYLLRILTQYVNKPDPVDTYARKVIAENEKLLK